MKIDVFISPVPLFSAVIDIATASRSNINLSNQRFVVIDSEARPFLSAYMIFYEKLPAQAVHGRYPLAIS